ncbi:MAG: TolC family protein [Bacteroidales bacterium]
MNKKSFLVALLVSSVYQANANNDTIPQMLSIDEALHITMTSNPMMDAIKYEEDAANKERKAALGLYFPKIGVVGTYALLSDDIAIDANPVKEELGAVAGSLLPILPPNLQQIVAGKLAQLAQKDLRMVIQDNNFGVVGANVTMPIFTGGKIIAANNAARIKQKEAEAKGMQNKSALVSELIERYYGLSLSQQVTLLREQVLEGMHKHLEDAIALEENGMIAKGERLHAQSYEADAVKEYNNAKLFENTINTALLTTLNQENEMRILPASSLFIVTDLESVDYFKKMALAGNPLVEQVKLKGELAREGVKLQRSEFMPQVAVMGVVDVYNHQLTKYAPKWAIGAGVKMNIFDGLHREHKYGAAKSTVKQADAYREKAENDIQALVEKLYNSLLSSAQQIPALEASVEFAKEYLRIKEVAFTEGSATSNDVVDARLHLAKKQTERLQAAYTYDITLAKLLEACGQSERFLEYCTRPSNQIISYK